MKQLTIVFGPSPVPLAFLYSNLELADKAFSDLEIAKRDRLPSVNVMDDFGQHGCFTTESIHAFMLEDLDRSKMAHVERGLHQARTQAKAQQMASADPALRAAASMASNGPAILSPMNGRFS